MTKILLIAATEDEIKPLYTHCKKQWIENGQGSFTNGQKTLEFLITGVGMVRTAFAMGNRFAFGLPDLAINAGIAGSFKTAYQVGDTVHVVHDMIYEFGAEDADGTFLSMQKMNLEEDIANDHGLINTRALDYAFLPAVKGITVNLVHGSQPSIQKVIEANNPDIETMESAAFMHSCLKTGVRFLAIRTISNMVEERNREKWNIPLAINNLNEQLRELISIL